MKTGKSLSKFFRVKKKKEKVKQLWRTNCEGSPETGKPATNSRMVCLCYDEDDVKKAIDEEEKEEVAQVTARSACEESEVSDVDWERDTSSARRVECAIEPVLKDQCVSAKIKKYMSSHSMLMVQEFANAIAQQNLIDDINCYVDELLEVYHRYVDENRLDPYIVKDLRDTNFSSLTLYGVRSLHRTANARLYQEDCGTLMAEIRGGFKEIRAIGDVRQRLCPGMAVKGQLRSKFENTDFYVKMRFSARNWMKPTLQDFAIYDWGTVKIRFLGTNWLGNMVHCTTQNVLPNVLTEKAKRKLPSILKARFEDWLYTLTDGKLKSH